MPLVPRNEKPPFNATRLSHVVLTSRDLDATRHFYGAGSGLEVTSHDGERLCMCAIKENGHRSVMFEKSRTGGRGLCRAVD
ncbi:MAG: hypothetical protein OXN84_10265 [Albidovulum sp.]|nr:hypothetical protein [Albidovulum sp.]